MKPSHHNATLDLIVWMIILFVVAFVAIILTI